ncbi:MAG: family 16 glycosylhydrolase [Anaerolineales bacterium]|nr:family 16 glycosylhydrolase [Anaerolineales bacterium]MCW5855703.1 family 16 glycosylhydrolase [Anaerolineales bacterium]
MQIRSTPGAAVEPAANGWRLSLPAGDAGQYRLAQLDDYSRLPRRAFPHRPPCSLQMRARAAKALPGTWGFGLWNDPFGLSLGLRGTQGRLPSLPNAAWFFFASAENHLSLHDEQPGYGALVGGYASQLPIALLAPGVIAAPLLAWRPAARQLRRIAARAVQQDLHALVLDTTAWHTYHILWDETGLEFRVDGQAVLRSSLQPRPPLGLVLWLDNQYAAWRPDGSLAAGSLATPPGCWIEISDLHIE